MKRTILSTVVAILIGLTFNSCEPPTEAETTGSIEGIIYDASTSQQLGGVTVTTEPITSSKITDTNGGFLIEGVEPETYTLQAAKTGYNTNSTTVNVVAGETTTADLQLTPLAPELSVSTALLNYGTSSDNLTFTITNTGVGVLTWNVISVANWITVNPANGSTESESDVVTVSVDRNAMSYGNHYETITIGSNANSVTIDILMTIQNPNAPQLSVYPVSMDFGSSDTEMPVNIQNTGTGLLTWNVTDDKSWISVSPQSGTTEYEVDELVVTIDRLNQSPGVQTGTITVSSDGGNQVINVQFTVPDEPTLSVTPSSLDFGSEETILPITIANAGSGSLSWSVSDNQAWITASPTAGIDDGTVNITISRDGVSPGDYSGTVTIDSDGGTDYVEIIMTMPADTPPTAVELQTPSEITVNSILLNWTRNFDSDFAAYKVYRDLSPAVSQNSELITTITGNSDNSYSDTGLQASTTYYYRVYVMDMVNQHTESNVVSATTLNQLGNWSINATLGTTLTAVDALNESFAYAVGSGGVIYYYNGSEWNPESSPTTSTIYDIKIISQTDIWAVGNDIYHFNGVSWSVAYETNTCYSIDVVSATDIYVGSINGIIYHYDGSAWTFTTANAGHIKDIQMDASDSGWALASDGEILYYNGFGWSLQHDIERSSCTTISVSSTSDIWVGSAQQFDGVTKLGHWDGSEWLVVLNGYGRKINSMRALSGSDIWFIGSNPYYGDSGTNISHWNGTSLQEITSPTSNTLYDIYMMSETDGWAVGGDGVVLRYH
ncbi:MAG: hypothetical protein HN936_10170 [Bacteroidetes bacterium]|jgi:hypothetical protein|nr:hypothetical protein [Bacteroidota bacterium]